ncbi:MAG: hypothetical protein WBA90_11775, partial [Albidovulum sp.]
MSKSPVALHGRTRRPVWQRRQPGPDGAENPGLACVVHLSRIRPASVPTKRAGQSRRIKPVMAAAP